MKNIIYLLRADLIWGAAFVSQRTGGDAVGAYSFNCIRFLIGAIVLIPIMFILEKIGLTDKHSETREEKRLLWIGGIVCGIALCFASNFQQVGITMGAAVGKAGFLTACYIIFVPLLGIFLKKPCSWNIIVGVALALVGLDLLCMQGGDLKITLPDLLLLLCALAFAIQILAIDYFAPKVNTVKLSCIEFFVCGLLSAVPMFISDIRGCDGGFSDWINNFTSIAPWIAILYAGICSSGIAYTLQIAGQKNFNPTIASLLMSLESVFSVIFGWLLLKENMSNREILGCVAIFAANIVAQIPVGKLKKA